MKTLVLVAVFCVCCSNQSAFSTNSFQKLNSKRGQLEADLSKIIDDDIGTWCEPRDEDNIITNTAGPRKRLVEPPSKDSSLSENYSDYEEEIEVVEESMGNFKKQGSAKPESSDVEYVRRWSEAALRMAPHAAEKGLNLSENVPGLFITPRNAVKHLAVLPDGSLKRVGSHDIWLALDFLPRAMMGHVIHLFAVDFNTSEYTCTENGGTTIGHRECIYKIYKNKCNHFIDRRRSASHRRRNAHPSKKCEIDFLPLVHLANTAPRQIEQKLVCRDDLPGFANCPSLRSREETAEIICDPLSTNTKRCDTTHEYVRTRCRAFETCDQAVILAGGWNWQMSGYDSLTNVLSMYKLFRHSGFGKQNIKIFFANGVRVSQDVEQNSLPDDTQGTQTPSNQNPAMYPSALKLALRYHTRTLCSTAHCVDSLVVYLSSPTRSDGAMYLWDSDGNGQADETEVYLIREFLRDIQECQANQLVVIADQSHAGLLVEAIAKSKKHSNTIIFASGGANEVSRNSELTKHWTGFKHSHTCVGDVFNASVPTMLHSTPLEYDGTNGSKRLNIFGAPCDILPPFTRQELRSHFMGCQNIPTRIWLNKNSKMQTDPPPRYLIGR